MRACRPSSSLIDKVSFDEDNCVLTVELAGRRSYAYFEVPRAVYNELCSAVSPGSFYNRCIKGRFACREVSPRRKFRPVEA